MKLARLLILVNLIGTSLNTAAQINTFDGLIAVDSTNFSSACPYIFINPGGLWQQGISQKNYLQPNNLQHVLITDTLNNYAVNVQESFEIHWPVNSNSIFNFILSFDHSMDSDSSLDGGRIEVSYDYGQTWIDIYEDALTNVAFNTENFYAPTDTLFDGRAGFSGHFAQRHSRLQWVWILPLKSFPTDTMYYRFLFKSDGIDHHKEGWMLENVHFAYADMQGELLNDQESLLLFECSPNPCDDQLNIATELKEFTISIFDLNGALLQSCENEKTLNLSGFLKGIYFVKITTPEGKSSLKKVIRN